MLTRESHAYFRAAVKLLGVERERRTRLLEVADGSPGANADPYKQENNKRNVEQSLALRAPVRRRKIAPTRDNHDSTSSRDEMEPDNNAPFDPAPPSDTARASRLMENALSSAEERVDAKRGEDGCQRGDVAL